MILKIYRKYYIVKKKSYLVNNINEKFLKGSFNIRYEVNFSSITSHQTHISCIDKLDLIKRSQINTSSESKNSNQSTHALTVKFHALYFHRQIFLHFTRSHSTTTLRNDSISKTYTKCGKRNRRRPYPAVTSSTGTVRYRSL